MLLYSDRKDCLDITFRNLDASNVADFKLLNQVIFPVKYSERFYTECRAAGKATQLAFDGETLVGAIACRLETQPSGYAKLYIMTLGVYAPYRGHSVGSRLLEHALAVGQADKDLLEAYLHVQVSNVEAIDFYTRRFGFQKGEVLQNYYRRIEPPHAVVLRKVFRTEE